MKCNPRLFPNFQKLFSFAFLQYEHESINSTHLLLFYMSDFTQSSPFALSQFFYIQDFLVHLFLFTANISTLLMNQPNLLGHVSFALADASCPPPIKTDSPASWSVTDQLQVFICCNYDKQRSPMVQILKVIHHMFCCSDWLYVYPVVSILQVHKVHQTH